MDQIAEDLFTDEEVYLFSLLSQTDKLRLTPGTYRGNPTSFICLQTNESGTKTKLMPLAVLLSLEDLNYCQNRYGEEPGEVTIE